MSNGLDGNGDRQSQRGILTDADRAVLRGDHDLSEGGVYNRRRFIRERLQQAILDFGLLFDELSESDRKRVFADLEVPQHPDETDADRQERKHELLRGMTAGMALFYRGIRDYYGDDDLETFGERIEQAVKMALETEFTFARVDASYMTVEVYDDEALADLTERYNEGEDLDADLVVGLLRAGVLDVDEMIAHERETDSPTFIPSSEGENWVQESLDTDDEKP